MKVNPKYLKYIRPVMAIIVISLGIVFLLIPFIPLGYILIFAGMFLLVPYIPVFNKWIKYLKKKDNKDRIGKTEEKLDRSENWIYKKFSDKSKVEVENQEK